jgi:hypothetical protein
MPTLNECLQSSEGVRAGFSFAVIACVAVQSGAGGTEA